MVEPSLIIAWLIDGLAYAMLLFLIASGFSIIFGLLDILNFAHGAFFMMGAYVATTLFPYLNDFITKLLGTTLFGLDFILTLLGAALFGLVLGVVLEYLTLRRVQRNPIAQILLTLGYLLILTQIVLIIWGRVPKQFIPLNLVGSTMMLGIRVPIYRSFLIFFGLIIAASTYLFLTKTRLGTIVRAGTEDAEMVEALGINVKRTFTLTFGLGTLLAALGGAAAVPWLAATPDMGANWLFTSLVVTVVGGLGNFKGSFYGSLLIGLINQFAAYFVPQLTFVIEFVTLTAVLLIRPEGLFGERK